jgi:hypothetical protein
MVFAICSAAAFRAAAPGSEAEAGASSSLAVSAALIAAADADPL